MYAFVVIFLIPSGTFAYALIEWRRELQKAAVPFWRRIAANLGFIAVAAQGAVLLSVSIWPQLSRMPLLSQWARWVFPTFIVAVPFVLVGKGASRSWLLSSSLLLFIFCFSLVLSP
jgi:hypothetical protein